MGRPALFVVMVTLCLASGVAPAAAAPASPPASPPAASQPAVSQPASSSAPARLAPRPGDRVRVNWYVDLPVTFALGSTFVSLELAQSRIGPKQCRWCEPHLNGFDAAGRHARWSHPGAADTLSSVVAFGLTPVVAEGLVTWDAYHEGGWRQAVADNLVIIEAAAAAVVLVDGVKYGAARQRPYVRDLSAGTALGGDDNLSFPSGHTALAFALATAAGTVATMRGYRHAPWVWGTGMALAAFTGYLRMAADKHYASDALVGAAIGSLVGWAVPYLLHRGWRR